MYAEFAGKSIEELREYLGGVEIDIEEMNKIPKYSVDNFLDLESVADNFDSRTQWPSCVKPPRN